MNASSDGKTVDELKLILSNDTNNHDLRLELAEKYFAQNQSAEAFQELLHIFSHDAKWNDEAAKKKLLEYFDHQTY